METCGYLGNWDNFMGDGYREMGDGYLGGYLDQVATSRIDNFEALSFIPSFSKSYEAVSSR